MKCALIFPTSASAQRCKDYIIKFSSANANPDSVHISAFTPVEKDVLLGSKWTIFWVVAYDLPAMEAATKFWQHSGEGISSRRAESTLNLILKRADGMMPTEMEVFPKPRKYTYGENEKTAIRKYVLNSSFSQPS
jgi:hypothetical protein